MLHGQLYKLLPADAQPIQLSLTQSLAEQCVLQAMLTNSKPTFQHCFYQRPLPNGSRFSSAHRKDTFYASTSIAAELAEMARLRLVFYHSVPSLGGEALFTRHHMMRADYTIDRGIKLFGKQLSQHHSTLMSQTDYSHCQLLSDDMRKAGVEAIEYLSARADDSLSCLAIFSSDVVSQLEPKHEASWLCETTSAGVTFKSEQSGKLYHFPINQFLVDGTLPIPKREQHPLLAHEFHFQTEPR